GPRRGCHRSGSCPCGRYHRASPSSQEPPDEQAPGGCGAGPGRPAAAVVLMDADLVRLDRARCEVGDDERDVAVRREHRVFRIDAALAHTVAGVAVDVAYDHQPLGIADVPELAVREAVEGDAAGEAVG